MTPDIIERFKSKRQLRISFI